MGTMMWIKCLVMVGVLLVCSYFDIKEKKVPLTVILIGIGIVSLLDIIGRDMGVLTYIVGISLGLGLILFSRLSRNALGMGDALLVLMIGAGVGIYQTVLVLFYGLLVTAVISLILLGIKRINRKSQMPFVPFLLIGYVGVILSWQI